LNSASVILLLISSDFLVSDYCSGIEMERALQRHQANEACVIPILLRTVDWKGAPFAHLQALPTNTRPITSWSNPDEAFADVAAGIRRAIEELTSLSASTPCITCMPLVWNVPYRRNPFFTGREDLLRLLRDKLTAVKTAALTQPQAVSGLGGIGKTQIALEYAYQYREAYRFVFWTRAAIRETLVADFVTIADLLHLPEKNEQDQNQVIIAVKKWLATHSDWLLILDNADDVTMVGDFMPTDSKGHIALTSRAQAFGLLAERINVETMGMVEGVLLLLHRAKLLAEDAFLDQVSEEHLADAEAIIIEMDFLPLALDQAGAYIEEVGCSLAAYLDLYRTHRKKLLQRRGQLLADHPEPVATTWSLSFQKVEQANPTAAELLRFCAFLEPDTIPEDLFSEGPILQRVAADAFILNGAIEELRKFSLVQRNPDAKTLSIHRLVQAVIKDAMKWETQRQWAERVVRVTNAVFPEDLEGMEMWSYCQRYLSQVQSCATLIQDYALVFEEAASLLHRAAWYLCTYSLYEQAELLYQCTLHILEQTLGPKHPDVAYPLNGLANLYRNQGKHAQAEPLYQRALRIREQVLGSEHPDIGSQLDGLADLYFDQGKYAQAEPLYQRALHILKRTLGLKHRYTLDELAELYGDLETVEWKWQHYLLPWEDQASERKRFDEAYSLNNLANLYFDQGKHAQAEPLYQRALRILEGIIGPDHPDLVYPLNGLADLYSNEGKHAQAALLYQRALSICKQQLDATHPHTLAIRRHNLALFQAMERKRDSSV